VQSFDQIKGGNTSNMPKHLTTQHAITLHEYKVVDTLLSYSCNSRWGACGTASSVSKVPGNVKRPRHMHDFAAGTVLMAAKEDTTHFCLQKCAVTSHKVSHGGFQIAAKLIDLDIKRNGLAVLLICKTTGG